jgi:glyoxalase/bleomycin resistance protein/dioxygenase superfamily protein
VPRLADAPAFLVGELGGVPYNDGAGRGFRFACWGYAGGGRIEILEPRGADSFLHRFLAERGPRVHHLTFKVPRLREACDRAEARGYPVVGYDDSRPDWSEAFLHPKRALGIVVQLVQTDGRDGRRPWRGPSSPPDPPPPVTVLGLRLSVHSPERARVQWVDIMQGQESVGPAGEIVYRWPGSPMRLAVEVDGMRAEGPLAIELTADRPLALPDGPHPHLGAVFRVGSGL